MRLPFEVTSPVGGAVRRIQQAQIELHLSGRERFADTEDYHTASQPDSVLRHPWASFKSLYTCLNEP